MKRYFIALTAVTVVVFGATAIAVAIDVGGKVGVNIGAGGVSVGVGGQGGINVGPGPSVNVGAGVGVTVGNPPPDDGVTPPPETPPDPPPTEDSVRGMLDALNPQELDRFLLNCGIILATPAAFPANYVLVCQLAVKVLQPPNGTP